MLDKLRLKVLKILPIPEEVCNAFFAADERTRYVKAKEYYTRSGDVSRELAFLNSGVMRMFFVRADGKEINIRFFFENDFVVSYQSFLLQKPGRYFIQALKDCELVTIPYSTLQNAYTNSPLHDKFGRIIAERSYIHAEQHTESLLFYNAQERYLKLLKAHPRIFEQVPLYHIASYLGIERESLSRLRRKLSKPAEIVT